MSNDVENIKYCYDSFFIDTIQVVIGQWKHHPRRWGCHLCPHKSNYL